MLNTPSPIPFDFLINGTFLRTTIDEYLTANGLSSETTLNLQYARSLIPPLFEASFEHDDWVSCVDVLSSHSPAATWHPGSVLPGEERILSGSYDGLLRVWNKSGQAIATSTSSSLGGHTSGIKAAKFLSPTQIASSGLDRTIRLWKYSESQDHFSAKLKPTLELYGHRCSVDSIAVHSPTSRILSASLDGTVGIWSTKKADAPAPPSSHISSKRRKLPSSTSTPQRGPLSLIPAHSAPATAVIFHPDDPTFAYSVSQDHTVKTLDLTTSTVVDTRTTSHSLFSIASLPSVSSSHILSAGSSARHITLLDPRTSSTTTAIMTLRGHNNKILSLSPDPDSTWGLVSGSQDGTCRVWDLRSTRQGTRDECGGVVGECIYVIERESHKGQKTPACGEGVKVFGVVWDKEVGIVSASEDKRVQINRGNGVTRVEG